MKIYIVGKYSGLDHQAAVDKFAKTEKQLIDAGVPENDIMNPMRFGIHQNAEWSDAMKICLAKLKNADSVYVQSDWKESFGARKEVTMADQHNYNIYWEDRNDIEKIRDLVLTRNRD